MSICLCAKIFFGLKYIVLFPEGILSFLLSLFTILLHFLLLLFLLQSLMHDRLSRKNVDGSGTEFVPLG